MHVLCASCKKILYVVTIQVKNYGEMSTVLCFYNGIIIQELELLLFW